MEFDCALQEAVLAGATQCTCDIIIINFIHGMVYFPILKELIIYVSYCFISINNWLLAVKCCSSLLVSGFSRNEFNSCILLNFCRFIYF